MADLNWCAKWSSQSLGNRSIGWHLHSHPLVEFCVQFGHYFMDRIKLSYRIRFDSQQKTNCTSWQRSRRSPEFTNQHLLKCQDCGLHYPIGQNWSTSVSAFTSISSTSGRISCLFVSLILTLCYSAGTVRQELVKRSRWREKGHRTRTCRGRRTLCAVLFLEPWRSYSLPWRVTRWVEYNRTNFVRPLLHLIGHDLINNNAWIFWFLIASKVRLPHNTMV